MKYLRPCDRACPSLETIEAVEAQNWGCLPCPFEIKQMLSEGKVWMCHSDRTQPCVATGQLALEPEQTAVTTY